MGTGAATLIERSARLETADIDFEMFRTRPLDAASLRCLRYMHDVEGHTMCYLRDVLTTRAHREPELTAFLACWAYEEHWHGEALARVLAAHGEPSGYVRLEALRRRLPRREGARPLMFSLTSALVRQMSAVQMAWGAVNEWSTQAGYARLLAKANHPVLTELLRRVMRQEGRHIDFYSSEACRRLVTDRTARRFTRFALRCFWSPVGSTVMPHDDVRFLSTHLFGDQQGVEAARRIDRQVDRLPGLEGLHLFERAIASRCVAGTNRIDS